MGNPRDITETHAPSADELENETYAAFPDMDASPTKAWLVAKANDAQWKNTTTTPSASTPERNSTISQRPDQVRNIADDPAYTSQKQELADRLMKTLAAAGDPHVVPPGDTFLRSRRLRIRRRRKSSGAA